MTPPTRPTGRLARRPVVAAGLVLAGLAAVRVADPARRDLLPCPFHVATGLWCPLCGGLRAASALTRLDVTEAFRDNAVLVLSLPLLVVLWLGWLRADDRSGQPIPRPVLVALWTVALAFTVLRNLPTLAWLRPTP